MHVSRLQMGMGPPADTLQTPSLALRACKIRPGIKGQAR